jgi:hypothetical protein
MKYRNYTKKTAKSKRQSAEMTAEIKAKEESRTASKIDTL